MFVHANIVTLTLFCLFSLLMFVLVCLALRRSRGFKLWLSIFVVAILIGSLQAMLGLSKSYPIPVLPLFFLGILVMGASFAFSASGKDVSRQLSLPVLIGFQSFRLPLELLLHEWASQGTIPGTMTWTGSNWDIAAGILSLIGIWLVGRNHRIAWAINVIGFLLLLNVLRVVIMSSPFPFSWQLKTSLQLAIYFPYVLIGPLFVVPAFTAHLLTFRKLWDVQKA